MIENIKGFGKLDFEKRKPFETEMLEIKTKIKKLENENMVLRRNHVEKRRNVINRCSKLINENKL